MKKEIKCPSCGSVVETYKNPIPTVDTIIHYRHKIVLIKRGEPPFGLALPGGFVEYGESLEDAACREALEETNLRVENLIQFKAYSDPSRDKRQHNITVVFYGDGKGNPSAGSDARAIVLFSPEDALEHEFAFDHKDILFEYINRILKI